MKVERKEITEPKFVVVVELTDEEAKALEDELCQANTQGKPTMLKLYYALPNYD